MTVKQAILALLGETTLAAGLTSDLCFALTVPKPKQAQGAVGEENEKDSSSQIGGYCAWIQLVLSTAISSFNGHDYPVINQMAGWLSHVISQRTIGKITECYGDVWL